MSLPVFRRFSQADVPTAPNWIQQVFGPLNIFCEQTVQILNKNLVIGENVQGMKYTTSFTTLSTYMSASDFSPITFNFTSGGQPNCCMIGQISRADGVVITTPSMVTSWFLNINQNPALVTINFIAGLAANTKYNITFVVI